MKMFKIRDLDGTSAYDRIEDTLKSYKNMHKEESRGTISLPTSWTHSR